MSSTQKDDKPAGSKLSYKGQVFQMDKQSSGQASLNGASTSTEASGAEKKSKASLMLKKNNDFNLEATQAAGDAKPQVSQVFSPPFMPTTAPIPTMATPQPAPAFGMPSSFMPSYPQPMMMGMPMTNMTWPFQMTGFPQTGAQVAQVPTVAMTSLPLQVPTTQQAPVAAPQVTVAAGSANERWREKIRQKKEAEKEAAAASTAQKTAPPKEEPKKEEPPKQETPKREEPKVQEPAPQKPVEKVEDRDSDDDDSYNDEPAVETHEKEEEEDYSKYPQERPRKIIYSRDMILEFIRKEADREDKDLDEQFEDLMRDIQIINKTPGFRPNKPPYSGGGGGRDRDRGDKGSRPSRYGGGPRKDAPPTSSTYNEPKMSAPSELKRARMTSAEKKRYEQIKKDTGDLISKRDQADEKTKQKKEINLYLFQLTPENYEEISEKLKPFCSDIDTCEMCIHMLIDKAWSQTKYTEIYARLCSDLGNLNFEWFENMSDEKRKEVTERHKDSDCLKIYRSFVVNKVRVEFMKGFEKFRTTMAEAESKEEFSDEDKTAAYNRAKGKVLANMSFIAELFKRKYIPPKVIKTITYIIIQQFIEDFCRESNTKALFSTSEVFLEAFFRLMEICGDMIESRENREDGKKSGDQLANEKARIQQYVDTLLSIVKTRKLDKEIPKVITEDEKKSINVCNLMFTFLRALKESGKVSSRLTSLIENAEDNRRNQWKGYKGDSGPKRIAEVHREVESKTRGGRDAGRDGGRRRDDDYKGGRYGGRSGRYEDDYYSRKDRGGYEEEYVPVSTPGVASKKTVDQSHVEGLVKAIFESTKPNDIEELTKQLTKDNKDFDGAPGEFVLASFLKHFVSTSASNADLRTAITPALVKSFGVTEEQFLSAFATASNDLKYEDLPFLKKVFGKLLVLTSAECGFSVEKMVVTWPADEDDKDELKFFLRDVCEEAEKAVGALGKDAKIAASIKAFSQKSL